MRIYINYLKSIFDNNYIIKTLGKCGNNKYI